MLIADQRGDDIVIAFVAQVLESVDARECAVCHQVFQVTMADCEHQYLHA
jgi:hypothetical protein